MTVLGFKCIQRMSGTGGDIELYRHVPHWWNNEVAGYDFLEFMFHGTHYKAHRKIMDDGAIKAGFLTKGQKGKIHCYFALKDPLLKIHGGKFRQYAKETFGNKYHHYHLVKSLASSKAALIS